MRRGSGRERDSHATVQRALQFAHHGPTPIASSLQYSSMLVGVGKHLDIK